MAVHFSLAYKSRVGVPRFSLMAPWSPGTLAPFSFYFTLLYSTIHVQMWEFTIKKTEHQRVDAFKLWCWRRLLRVPWTARRSNQSILKEISPDYSLEGPMLKLSSNIWPPDVKSQLIGKDLDAGKDWGQEEKRMTEDEMVGWHHWLDDMSLSKI